MRLEYLRIFKHILGMEKANKNNLRRICYRRQTHISPREPAVIQRVYALDSTNSVFFFMYISYTINKKMSKI